MLVHLFPKYFEIIFLSSVCGSVWTRWPPKRSNPRFGLIFLVLELASRNFRDLLDIFYWLQCTFQILRFFEIWPKIGQILFFSTILYYNLTKSPTNFIFGVYAIWGVPDFVLVFEKNRTGCFKVIRPWFFLFFENHKKRFNSTLKLVFHRYGGHLVQTLPQAERKVVILKYFGKRCTSISSLRIYISKKV